MAKEKITAGLLTEVEIGGAVDLLKEVFEETGAQKRSLMNKDFYRWQYIDTRSPVVVAREGKAIVAHYPLTTYNFLLGKEVGKTAVIQDLVTKSDCRKRGAFKLMGDVANEVCEKYKYDLIYAFPNPKSFPGFVKHHGYTHLLTIPLFVSPVSLSEIVRAKLKFPPAAWPFKPIDYLLRIFTRRKSGRFKVEEHDAVPEGIDRLWESSKDKYGSALVRDSGYVRWRFRGRPGSVYRIFTATDGDEIVAYAVLGSGLFFGLPTAVIMDFFAAEGKDGLRAFKYLIREIKGAAHERGDGLILTATRAESGINRVLYRAGFIRVPDPVNPRKLKLVVRPISGRAKKYVLSKREWFLTLADWDVL
ncbi:MAG: GNAT family N-acetyltransferase [Deltaproteobacteria bacterium]|uniref:GNAT family N-acetyltransferase n=1 Tax=Candidatus Zymogenus saltonus TaxID=2844893 RepID=A0A9D8KC40_9DELT|nr:GNAT family N-acetyltransferase [Candidatus Zymogenus saltonus]